MPESIPSQLELSAIDNGGSDGSGFDTCDKAGKSKLQLQCSLAQCNLLGDYSVTWDLVRAVQRNYMEIPDDHGERSGRRLSSSKVPRASAKRSFCSLRLEPEVGKTTLCVGKRISSLWKYPIFHLAIQPSVPLRDLTHQTEAALVPYTSLR